MHHRIGAQGDDVFFGQRLDAVGNGLEKSEGTNAVGTEAVLNAGQSLALEDRGQGKERRKKADDGRHAEQHSCRRLPRSRQKADQPVLEQNENLVQILDHRLRPLSGDGRGFGCDSISRGLGPGVGLGLIRR